MPDPIPSFAERSLVPTGRRISIYLVIAFLGLTIFAFLVAPVAGLSWLQKPFIGALLDQNLIAIAMPSESKEAWNLHSKTPGYGYQLLEINDSPVQTNVDVYRQLDQHTVGETAGLALRSPAGLVEEFTVILTPYPAPDRLAYFYVPYFIGLVYALSSLWVFILRYKDPAGRAFTLFSASIALTLASFFDAFTTHHLSYLYTLGIGLSGGALFNLALLFPEEVRLVERFPFLRWVGYLPVLGLVAFGFPAIYNYARPYDYLIAWRFAYLYASLGLLFFLALTAARYFTSTSPIAREQARLIVIGAAVSFVPTGGWFLLTLIYPEVMISPIYLLAAGVFPIITGYTILRYRMLKTDTMASRVVLYGLLTLIVSVSYALALAGLSQILGAVFTVSSPYIMGALVFILALLINPLRVFLQKWVDRVFSRGQEIYRERMQAFSRDLTQAMELPAIVALLRRTIVETLSPSQVHIFIYDGLSDHYTTSTGEDSPATTDLRFAADSSLVQVLGSRRKSIFLGEASTVPSALQSEKARLLLLNAQAFIPLPGRSRLAGWVALGPRGSGAPYVDRDLTFLESISDQAALAVERAQVLANLERRMHEMNALTRVSQGINVTLAFDDMLEMIYAQTNQVIPALDFRITLVDSFSHYLYHVFFLENDDRLNQRENLPLPVGQGLEQELIDSRRPVQTEDYERECRNRGVLPSAQGIYAWMGVPLNSGAETIGVISLGSRDPAVSYSEQQMNLLQAIADQTAGAIVKARLLQEAERRTRQLTTLNEVARSLTSTLELDRLLTQILNSAQEILNCSAGSLLLVDEQTDELVFEVATGPVAPDLIGKRLPPGTGLVGKAVETRAPVVANDVRGSKEWLEDPDQQTGFSTQDLLVVPMQVKDRVIGVIEVLNRKDGLPFTPDDQELLAAFTSQAAVAIENARLYTLTDQALADRVEELSVMQRIDRELNASLDVSRAMRITLGWALRQSSADAGLVGVVEEDGVHIMASSGYTAELQAYKDNVLPKDLPGIQKSVETGQVKVSHLNGSSPEAGILAQASSQVSIPIRREDETIGIMLLESKTQEEHPADTIDFLVRLSDHAAIAIANAQLYSAVQAANQAKSKFVSFVAHELKNPMASIKGYTELVSGGMAGPINEMQATFLATVSSNLDRMNTIVSDLNDVTKIETGGMRLDYKPVQVHSIVEEVVRSLRKLIEDKHQHLTYEIPSGLPPLWADPSRLAQILTNLISNAHKYTPAEGQIIIGVEACGPGDHSTVDSLHIWVKDSGIGISPEDQDKIFQQYFRTDSSKEVATGTGLGLNLTRTLVEMQSGQIWFDSELDKGTTFHVTLPVAETGSS